MTFQQPLRALVASALNWAGAIGLGTAAVPDLDLNALVLVDEVICGNPSDPHPVTVWPAGASQIQTILSQPARVLPSASGSGPAYFAYRIGVNKGLVAGDAYVLVVDYPEDQPRSMVIGNYGEASLRGLHTGSAIGDARGSSVLVPSNPESLNIPLAGTYRQYVSLFHLHDRFSDLQRLRSTGVRPFVPADGFWVTVARFAYDADPLSKGPAVSRIRLYKAPAFASYALELNFPPPGLPRRHLFVREEMADATAGLYNSDPTHRGVTDWDKYFEYKARLIRFLGMNTFTRDLLEFGSNQGFDSVPGGGNAWYAVSPDPGSWERSMAMADSYGLAVLPYYEYAGSRGSAGLGSQKRAKPLRPDLISPPYDRYTQINWTEVCRADLLDPDTTADVKLLLDVTLARFRKDAAIVGAWMRPRSSQMPISFSDANLAQFSEEVLGGYPAPRSHLLAGGTLYRQYKEWWFGKRRAFAGMMRDHLRAKGVNPEAVLLYTSDATESGRVPPSVSTELVAEDTAAWNAVGISSVTPAQALAERRHHKAVTEPRKTYSMWEWQHADPEYELTGYSANGGVLMTMPFNREYTVRDVPLMDAFRTPEGAAFIRHYPLNEDAMDASGTNDPLGYFVTDFDRAGPYCMMAEALAVANGDPTYIGYLSSNIFNRGFPGYVRAFNRAFLALPAVPSTVLTGAASDAAVVVRRYLTDGYGTYLAVVNTARTDKSNIVLALPERSRVVDAATNQELSAGTTTLSVSLYPFELRALRLERRISGGPVAVSDQVTVDEGVQSGVLPLLGNDAGAGLAITQVGPASHGLVSLSSGQVRYTPAAGYVGPDSFRYTVSNSGGTNEARVFVTVRDTAAAHHLEHWAFRPQVFGSYSDGKSRLLAGGAVAELTGSGPGLAGTQDHGYWDGRAVAGNFEVTVRLASLAGEGAEAGLMLRQDTTASSRMVALMRDAAGASSVHSRGSAGQDSLEVPAGLAPTTGPVWLRMRREGDWVTASISGNGSSFQVAGRRLLPGLPNVVRIGLIATGAKPGQPGRALFDGWAVQGVTLAGDTEQLVFQQDFNASTNPTAFIDATGTQPHLFRDISAEPQAGAWDIAEGSLRYTNASTGANDDAGFVCTLPLDGPPAVARMSFDLAVSGITTISTIASLELGQFPSTVPDYGSVGSYSTYFYGIAVKYVNGCVKFNVNGTDVGNITADGTPHAVVVYLNNSGATQTYTGPDGTSRLLNHRSGSIWINGALLAGLDNQLRHSNYTGNTLSNFRLRMPNIPGGQPFVMTFDNMVIANALGSFTPAGAPNQAPLAANDAATTTEGNSVLIPVLANDSDADRGPGALRIATVSDPPKGTATVESGAIRYLPDPGVYGTNADSFTYTVSDGTLNSAPATVTVTIPNAATSGTLGPLGLTGATTGGGTGASRIVPPGYAEVRHQPSGSPTIEQRRLESMSVSGNFTAHARLHAIEGASAGAWGGLIVSEGTESTARLVMLAATPAHLYYTGVRSTAGQPVALAGSAVAPAPPEAWLKLQRVGLQIMLSASPDGITYQPISTTTLPGLAANLRVGLFATNAILLADEFRVEAAQSAIFQQSFSSSSTQVASYVQELPPRLNLFTDISAEASGGAWSIYTEPGTGNKALQLDRNASPSDPPHNGAGFTKLASPAGEAPSAAVLKFDVAVSGFGSYNWIGTFEVGQVAGVTDYNSGIYNEQIANDVSIKSAGTSFRFSVNGVESPTYPANGSWVSVSYYLNYSGAPITYTGPDAVSRSLPANASHLWVGTARVPSDLARPAYFTGTKMSGLRFRSSVPLTGVLRLDNLSLSPLGPAANLAPQVVDDAASTTESTAVDIPVLANDLDPDDGPQALSISSVGAPAYGTASIVGSQVRYVPAGGYAGPDSFTYTVHDGTSQTTGQVQMTVTGGAPAPDLSGAFLTATNIGSGSSGGGSVLAGGQWEIRGTGGGAAGTADSLHGELAAMEGDFTMVVRVNDVTGGAAGRVGLVAREGTGPGARMMAVSMRKNGSIPEVRHAVRSAANGSAAEAAAPGTWSLPATWLLIERQGMTLTGAASTDGTTFIQVAAADLSGLAADLQIGLWMAGTDANGAGRVDSFRVEPALPRYFQAFGGSTNLADYSAPSPTIGQLHDIGQAAGNTWSIFGGALRLQRAAAAGAAGFTRVPPASGAPTAVELKFKVGVTGTLSGQAYLGIMQVGQVGIVPYTGAGAYTLIGNDLAVRANGSTYGFVLNGVFQGSYPANGTLVPVAWYSNYSGADLHYRGPDNQTYFLANNRCDLWVNGTRLFTGATRSGSFTSNQMGGFRFRSTTTLPLSFTFDDIIYRSIQN